MIILLILGLMAVILGARIYDSKLGLDQREVTEAHMRRIQEALVNFASLNQRLPCPADGSGTDGAEAATPAGPPTAGSPVAFSTCTFTDGVVPWTTLALRQPEALDGWGRRISYRVFSGTSGVTQLRYVSLAVPPRIVGGVSNIDCNASLGAPIDNALDGGDYCKPATGPAPGGSPPPNTPAQYLAAPGRGPMLVVQDQGATRNGLAFVLVSHGETGYGAFSAQGGIGRTQSPSGAGKEIVNAGAGGEYWIQSHSPPDIDVSNAAHFDDVVVYMTFSELVARANLKARSYSEYPLAAQFTQAAVEAASGASNIDSTMNTGLSSIALGGFLISASSSGGVTRNVGFREQGGDDGIGVIGGSSTSGDLNSSFGEKLTFQLGEGSQYAKVDIAFNVFEITDKSPLREERAEISFWRAGLPLQSITVDAWDEHPEVSRCLFRLPTALVFDRFDVAPLSQTGGGGSSRFTVAGVRACDNNTTPCETGVPSTAACPIFPVSAATRDASGIGTTGATLNARVEDNGIATGTGSGYVTNGDSYSFGERLITITGGSGTILDGNCIQVSGDATVYPVTRGITGPGEDLVIAMPGLRQSIPSSARNVTRVPCQTTVQFDWGSTCSSGYPSSTNATPLTINAGAGTTDVSAALTGLACGTPYHYRVRASNLIATTVSPNQQFRTSSCGFSTPTTVTGSPSISAGSVTFAGTINGNGESTTVSFEYGETSCYGSTVAGSPGTVAAGAGATAVIASLPVVSPPAAAGQLRCGTVYHYRVVALAGSGTRYGENVSFRTPDCP